MGITIAHKLCTVAGADVIVAMDKGKVVEMGNHERKTNFGKQRMVKRGCTTCKAKEGKTNIMVMNYYAAKRGRQERTL
jgi:ABC-type glutathione transport system ATPase component